MQEHFFSFLNISIDDSTGMLYSEWTQEPSDSEYTQGMELLAKCLVQYPIRYWIQDSVCLANVPLAQQRHTLQQMVPSVLNSRLEKIARIVSLGRGYRAMFDRLVEEEQVKAAEMLFLVNRNIDVQQFSSYQEAADWIAGIKV